MNAICADRAKSWRKIVFARDYQSLSFFRILFALLIGADFFLDALPYYQEFYTDHGILPRSTLFEAYPGTGVLSLLTLNDYWLFHVLFIAAHILAIFFFAIGYKTRWANLVLFVTYMSMHWRTPMLNSGAELLAKLFLLWSLFLPMARYWSVDAALDPEPRDRYYPLVPFFSIKMQVSLLYFFSALYKVAGMMWWNGTAIVMALKGNIYGGTPFGLLLADHLGNWLWLVAYGVMIFQLVFSVLVYFPFYNNFTRGLALIGATCMHISFIFMLNIGPFPYLCLIYLVILVPDEWWNALFSKSRARLSSIRIFYDPDCEFCKKTALLFREFCLPTTVPVLPADRDAEALALLRQNNSWVVYNIEGKPIMHWRAVAYVLRQNPLFWIFGTLTDLVPLRSTMRKFYEWIGTHRPVWGKLTSRLLPIRTQPAVGPVTAAFCGFLMILSLAFAVSDIRKPAIPLEPYEQAMESVTIKTPGWLKNMASFFQVYQRWNLFAPNPTHVQTRYVLSGTKYDGTKVDLTHLWSPPLFALEPNGYSLTFVNHFWLKYFERLDGANPARRTVFARYLCRRAGHNPAFGPMASVRFEIVREPEGVPWNDSMPPQISLDYPCAVRPAVFEPNVINRRE